MPVPPVLATKFFFPPARENRVSRPRLVEKVTHGLQNRLLLISAPAGYGKTTLMSEWRADIGCDHPAVWLSLDQDDNDFNYFLTSIAFALTTLTSTFGANTLSLLQSTPPLPDRVILTNLINELGNVEKPTFLILDDYHVISAPAIHEAITFLLDHLPPQMHLIILTRADPPLPLPRLRARNQLVEIRAADLRFTIMEANEFLNKVMGLSLSTAQVSELEQRTEGWVTGLQLSALSMQGREDIQKFISEFAGSHHYIVDYLADEVLTSQPASVQEFLLRTSILNRLSAPLCDVLADCSDGQAKLETLERANLFLIPLDTERHWFRYHQLFKDVLRSRLHQSYPGHIPDLYRRAALWLEQNSFFEEALNNYLIIKDFEEAARLASEYWLHLFRHRTMYSTSSLMREFPEPFIRKNPRLSLVYAWSLWLSGFRTEAEPYVVSAHQAVSNSIRLKEKKYRTNSDNALFAEATAFRSLVELRHGELIPAIKYAKQAVKAAPADEYYTQGTAFLSLSNAYRGMGRMEEAIRACTQAITTARLGHSLVLVVDSIYNLGRLLKIQGRLHRAAQVYEDGLRVAKSQGQAELPTYSFIHFGLADIYYQWNDLDESEHQLDLGFGLLEIVNVQMISQIGHIYLAQLKRARGDIQGALQTLVDVETDGRQQGITTIMDEFAIYKAGLQAELGYFTEVEGWMQTVETAIYEQLGYKKGLQSIQLARILIMLGEVDKALSLLSRIEKSAEAGKSIGWQIEALLLQVKALQSNSNTTQALACLEKALSLAKKDGFVRIFLDEGESIINLLPQAATKGVYQDYARKLLLAAFPAEKRATMAQALVEPLSERELEILRLVADGRSNQQIAEALFIAMGTVKKHLNNIFGKLGVKSRTQCVARGRELGIL